MLVSPTAAATSTEQQTIHDLRSILPQIDNLNDGYVLRWLRAKNGRFDDTAESLRKHVTFRNAWHLDRIHQWTPPECLEKYCGYGLLGDTEGRPILMSLLGNVDVEGLLRSVASLDYIKFSLAAIEKGMKLCEQKAAESGRPFEQMTLVFDLENITSAHFSCKQFASSFTTLVSLFQDHYPMVLRKILIIRAPEMARIAYASITAILQDPITRLVEMPSESDWKWSLAQIVNLDAWPMYWGGNLVENGDPKCPSRIKYGGGAVDESYFVDPKKAMADYDQLTTVYAGDKHLIQIKVKRPSRISWTYMTDEDDIGFEIHYDKTGSCDKLTEMETVYPYIRLECTNVPITGHLDVTDTGNYVLEFDNYYSWFSAKQLRYNIEIEDL
ncbi:hypothetical protein CAEBREN_26403 [Caenorhabditis brenneri]|uniref:Uncharacterized protein n=1 Tax=Caenorhabditis brenneri TaxID=135651 RepID=G0P307_CAEBE|nr:hypothetical protein CAEBREN_26403 [Caenorhabditis brenneri]